MVRGVQTKVPDGLDGCRSAVTGKLWNADGFECSAPQPLYAPHQPPVRLVRGAQGVCRPRAPRTASASPRLGWPTELRSANPWAAILSYHRKTFVHTAPISKGAAPSNCPAHTSQRQRLCQTGTLANASPLDERSTRSRDATSHRSPRCHVRAPSCHRRGPKAG